MEQIKYSELDLSKCHYTISDGLITLVYKEESGENKPLVFERVRDFLNTVCNADGYLSTIKESMQNEAQRLDNKVSDLGGTEAVVEGLCNDTVERDPVFDRLYSDLLTFSKVVEEYILVTQSNKDIVQELCDGSTPELHRACVEDDNTIVVYGEQPLDEADKFLFWKFIGSANRPISQSIIKQFIGCELDLNDATSSVEYKKILAEIMLSMISWALEA